MSKETASKIESLESLTFGQKNLLTKFLNFSGENFEVDWDIDQTLALTEYPVKETIDKHFGTSYFSRKIEGYETLTKWLVADGVTDLETAQKVERKVWVDPDILYQAKPNEPLRDLSYAMYKAGIPQNVTTVRVSGLRMSTYRWMNYYFPWIPAGKVNFKISSSISGHDFKLNTVEAMYARNPNIIHIDDDLRVMKALSLRTPEIQLIGIRYPEEDVCGVEYADHRAFLYRDELNALIDLPRALSY